MSMIKKCRKPGVAFRKEGVDADIATFNMRAVCYMVAFRKEGVDADFHLSQHFPHADVAFRKEGVDADSVSRKAYCFVLGRLPQGRCGC